MSNMSDDEILRRFEYESNAVVLRAGDVVVVKNMSKVLNAEDAQAIKDRFARYKIGAIVMGADWGVEREQPRFVDTGMVDSTGHALYRIEAAR